MLSDRSKQIRRDVLLLSSQNGGYHYGGSFSCVEILIALYDYVLGPSDKFILSKGHACWPLYVLLREPRNGRRFNPRIEGHPLRDEANGIHFTTGSGGHGLPAGIGMAIARKLLDKVGHIFVLVGDGECQEGTTWESMLIASHHELSNLTVIVDWNEIQGSGMVKDILPIPNFDQVSMLLGWDTIRIGGHDVATLTDALKIETACSPRIIIADTVKGKGVSYMENKPEWHARWPNKDEMAQAIRELQ